MEQSSQKTSLQQWRLNGELEEILATQRMERRHSKEHSKCEKAELEGACCVTGIASKAA